MGAGLGQVTRRHRECRKDPATFRRGVDPDCSRRRRVRCTGIAVVAGRVGGRIAGPAGVHVASTASLIAHCYPITRPGQGGKGVAASIGQVLVSFPAYFPIDAAVVGATYYAPGLRRDPRRATAVASVAWVACGLLWWRRRLPNLWGPPPSAGLAAAAAVSASVIALRFEQTVGRGDVTEDPT